MHSGAVNPHDQFLKEGWPIVSFLHTSGCVRAPLGFILNNQLPSTETALPNLFHTRSLPDLLIVGAFGC